MEKLVIGIGICSAVMSAVALLYIALSQLLKNKWSAKYRYYLWLFVLVGFLTPFKPPVGKPVYEIEVTVNSSSVQGENAQMGVWFFLSVIWIVGMVLLTAYYVFKQCQFNKYVNRFAKPCGKITESIVQAEAMQMGISRVKILTLPGCTTPMMTGFRMPIIMLPEKIYSKDELKLIIKHELSHYKRWDLPYKIFMLVCRIVHWFNPLMPLFVRHIERECELACDEIVMRGESAVNKKLYCQTVLEAVSEQNGNHAVTPIIASNFCRRKSYIGYRLSMILAADGKKSFAVVCLIVIFAVLFSGTVIAITYSSPDEVDSAEDSSFGTTTGATPQISTVKTTETSASTETSVIETVETTSKTRKETTEETTAEAVVTEATTDTTISTDEAEVVTSTTTTTTTTAAYGDTSASDITPTTVPTAAAKPSEQPEEESGPTTVTTCTTLQETTACSNVYTTTCTTTATTVPTTTTTAGGEGYCSTTTTTATAEHSTE